MGSQSILPPVKCEELVRAINRLGIPCYQDGMSRELLGSKSPLQVDKITIWMQFFQLTLNSIARQDNTDETSWRKPIWSFWPARCAISVCRTAAYCLVKRQSLPSTATKINCIKYIALLCCFNFWKLYVSLPETELGHVLKTCHGRAIEHGYFSRWALRSSRRNQVGSLLGSNAPKKKKNGTRRRNWPLKK